MIVIYDGDKARAGYKKKMKNGSSLAR